MIRPQPASKAPSGHQQAVVIIPARWGATRFPGKVLSDILGRPLLQRIIAVCRASRAVDQVIVATDDRRIFTVAEQAGAQAVMTSRRLRSGSDRVAAAARAVNAEIIVNVQGDEYFEQPRILGRLISFLRGNPEVKVATLARPISAREAADPHLVKVVCDRLGNALYFSRWAIPFRRGGKSKTNYMSHIGIYAFRRPTLLEFAASGKTPLEAAESLEQLRLLERGIRIRVLKTNCLTVGVDTPADLHKLRVLLKKNRLRLRGGRG